MDASHGVRLARWMARVPWHLLASEDQVQFADALEVAIESLDKYLEGKRVP